MIKQRKLFSIMAGAVLILLSSCAPQVSFQVTRPAELPVDNVNYISFGTFDFQKGSRIDMPKKGSGTKAGLSPSVTMMAANQDTSDLIRSILAASLSKEGQFQLLNTDNKKRAWNGVIPDASKTGTITARIRYFEKTFSEFEKQQFILLITKGGLGPEETVVLEGITKSVVNTSEKNGKGLKVPVGYIEKIAAMEIEYDLTRANNQQKIIPTQKFQAYYVKKWGGDENTSHLDPANRGWIVSNYDLDKSLIDQLRSQSEKLQLAYNDPQEFIALGGKLKQNLAVPSNSLDIQLFLAERITRQFTKKISTYTETATLEIANGDEEATTLLRGNAYGKAVNRLESLAERSEEDTYNLALAYESMGERIPALKYYQELQDQDPSNEVYSQAVKRLER